VGFHFFISFGPGTVSGRVRYRIFVEGSYICVFLLLLLLSNCVLCLLDKLLANLSHLGKISHSTRFCRLCIDAIQIQHELRVQIVIPYFMLKCLVLYHLHLSVKFLDRIKDAPCFQWLWFIHFLASELIENVFFVQFDGENSKWLPQHMIWYLSLCFVVQSLFSKQIKCPFFTSRNISDWLGSHYFFPLTNLLLVWVIWNWLLALFSRGISWFGVFDVAVGFQKLLLFLQFKSLFICLLLLFMELITVEDII